MLQTQPCSEWLSVFSNGLVEIAYCAQGSFPEKSKITLGTPISSDEGARIEVGVRGGGSALTRRNFFDFGF